MYVPSRIHLLAPLVALLLVAGAACSSDDDGVATGAASTEPSTSSTDPDPGPTDATGPPPSPPTSFTPAATGTLVTWAMTAGECFACGFELRLDADGTATYEPDLGRATVAFDADALDAVLSDLDPSSLVTGITDCGREVDGNAPVLTLHGVDGELELDDCFLVLDRDHPLLALVLDLRTEAEAVVVPMIAQVVIYGGRCPEGECRTVYTVYADGAWWKQEGPEDRFDGGLPDAETRRLVEAVTSETEDDIISGPFTGECPTAVDGQARAYTLYPDALDRVGDPAGPGTTIFVDTCRHEISPDAESIAALDELIATTSGG